MFLCVIIYWASYSSAKNLLYAKALILILLGGLVLRVFVASDGYLHEWDEKYHALVAKNMMLHPLKPTLIEKPVIPYDYRNFTSNHIWLEKGPVPLIAISLSLKLFGLNEFAVRIPSIILSLIAIYLTYLIAALLFDKKIALLAAFFHSINGYLIELAGGRFSSDHVETAFIFYVELSIFLVVYYIVKKPNKLISLLIGIATGLAILSKWSPALLVFPVWIIGALISKKIPIKKLVSDVSISIVALLSIVLPYQLFTLYSYQNEALFVIKKFLFAYQTAVDGHIAPWYYYINQIGIIFGELIFLLLLLSLFQIIKKQSNWKLILLSAWWIIPVIIFSFAETKRSTYILIAAPPFFIILSYYWFYLFEKIKIKKQSWAIIGLLVLLIVLPIRYSIERVKPFHIMERNPNWTVELKKINGILGKGGNIVVFNLEHNIEAMFYTDYIVYRGLPSSKQITQLQNKGYRIIINDDGKIKANLRETKGIEFIKLSSN